MIEFVLDSSFALSWAFEDERTIERERFADRLIARELTAIVPASFPFEVASGLNVAHRRGRISVQGLKDFLILLADLPIRQEPHLALPEIQSLLRLAELVALSPYDAAFLKLAVFRGRIPLATNDAKLEAAATKLGVPSYRTLLPNLP